MKHEEQPQMQLPDGRWVPSEPIPMYVRSWRTLWRWKAVKP